MTNPPIGDLAKLEVARGLLESAKLDEAKLPDGAYRLSIVDSALTALRVLVSSGDIKLSSDSRMGSVDQSTSPAVDPAVSSVERKENPIITLTPGDKLQAVLHLIGEMIIEEVKAAGYSERKQMLYAAALILRNHPDVPRSRASIASDKLRKVRNLHLREFVTKLKIETNFGSIAVLAERWELEEKNKPGIRGSPMNFFISAVARKSQLEISSVNAGFSKDNPAKRLRSGVCNGKCV